VYIIPLLGIIANFVFYEENCEGEASDTAYFSVYVLVSAT